MRVLLYADLLVGELDSFTAAPRQITGLAQALLPTLPPDLVVLVDIVALALVRVGHLELVFVLFVKDILHNRAH